MYKSVCLYTWSCAGACMVFRLSHVIYHINFIIFICMLLGSNIQSQDTNCVFVIQRSPFNKKILWNNLVCPVTVDPPTFCLVAKGCEERTGTGTWKINWTLAVRKCPALRGHSFTLTPYWRMRGKLQQFSITKGYQAVRNRCSEEGPKGFSVIHPSP